MSMKWLFWGGVGAIVVYYLFGPGRSSSIVPEDNYVVTTVYQQESPKIYSGDVVEDSTLNFMGDPCTQDCSGHEAGYDWASEKGIVNPGDCDGNSDSFIEGCRAYAEENSEEVYDSGSDDYRDYEY